jgi:hypothetical protein
MPGKRKTAPKTKKDMKRKAKVAPKKKDVLQTPFANRHTRKLMRKVDN